MPIARSTAFLILFGPAVVFLATTSLLAGSPWIALVLAIGAGLLNTTQVVLLAVAEQKWPANEAMRKPQRILDKIQENGPKVVGLTYLAAFLAWGLGTLTRGLTHAPELPRTEWLVPQVLAAFVVVDFGDYWMHRLQHRVAWLWRCHAIHHAVREFSLFGAAKIHWIDTPFVVLPGFFVLGACGMGAVAAAMTIIAWFALSTMLHVNAKLSLGWLDGVFQVPAVHHLHHEIGFDEAVSFGGIFCVFDRMFGTYRADGNFAEPVGIGPRYAASELAKAELRDAATRTA